MAKGKSEAPRVTKMQVSFGITANLGNYESCRVDLSVEAEVPDGHDPRDVHDKLCNSVMDLLGKQADKFGPVAKRILE